ncbi:ABC transporter permease, partial [bacterium]|nr:ABC transporter permease [bacterium]
YTSLEESAGLAEPHEIAIKLKDEDEVESYARLLQEKFPGLKVQTWRSLAPELGYADKMMDLVMTLFLSIIMAALAFGIVNTMLMAVLERKKELGMLMAVGMHKNQIFKMIMFETCMLSFIGAPIGMLMAIVTQLILGKTGIDLSFVAKGLESVGLESTIYPSLDVKTILILTVLVVITGILSAIYPARKALSLNPSETLRTAI